MPIYTVELDGKQYDLEGDHPPSEAEARDAIGSHEQPQPKQATPPPASATIGMIAASTPNGGRNAGEMTEANWAALSPQDKMRNVLQWGGNVIAGMTGMGGAGREAVENPKTTLAMAAVPGVISATTKRVPGVIEAGRKVAGISKVRAGSNIEAAERAAQGVPVATEKVGQEGLRAMELQAAGGRMPQVASKFMQRVTDPSASDLTFEEARDFYSNLSRMSANEYGNLNPTMQRQIGLMKEALHQALTDAAGTVGQGEKYAAGIKEYADAGRAAARWEAAKPALRKAMLAAAGSVGAGGLARAGWDFVD